MIDTSTPESFQKSWIEFQRPLVIVDEGRLADAAVGEYVLFVFAQTDTRTATEWATTAENIKAGMTEKKLPKVFKGKMLFGNKTQKFHDPYRNYVLRNLNDCEQLSFMLTTSDNLNELNETLGGGINLTKQSNGECDGKVTGRELLPFLSCLKQIAKDRYASHPFVDVLVDRSFHLGLDPSQRKIMHEQFQLIGPGFLNTASGGIPAILQVPNQFLLISTKEEGAFSDLLILPDSLAYLVINSPYLDAFKGKLTDTDKVYYWHDIKENLPLPKED